MLKWIHHLLEPHCKDCREERELLAVEKERAREANSICPSCETLKSQLAQTNHEKDYLLARILELTAPAKPEPARIIAPEALRPRTVPWRVRQQMLEEEDRNLAKVMAERQRQTTEAALRQQNEKQAQDVEQLEQELGVQEAK